jgi:phosphoglycolate phosphatase/putative hydrolase of the HAD superfamily
MVVEPLASNRQASGDEAPRSSVGGVLRPARTYATWLIDLDGTLYRQLPVRLLMAAELVIAGRSHVTLLKEFRREHERLHFDELPAGSNPFAVQLERASAKCNVPLDRAEQIISEWMIRRPGKWLRHFRRRSLIERIQAFRDNGGRTAIVSDYPAREKLRAMKIEHLFDAVIASGEASGPGQLKPSPQGMRLAANRLHVDVRDCLVIGDRWDADGAAAQAAGMDFLHVSSRWPT